MKKAHWFCDSCGKPITDANDGWVEWVLYEDTEGNHLGRGLRLVHCHRTDGRSCFYDSDVEYNRDRGTISSSTLDGLLEADGLMELLSLIAEKELPADDVLEMVKRLHIPGYEIARRHFEQAISDGVFEPNRLPGYYKISDIESVLEYIEENG